MKTAIIVGHTSGAQGARAYNGMNEYEFNHIIAQKLRAELPDSKVFERPAFMSFRDSLKRLKEDIEAWTEGANFKSIELHLNAFNKITHIYGSEILLMTTSSIFLANAIQKELTDTYNIKPRDERGYKFLNRYSRGYSNLKTVSRIEGNLAAVIVEPCFADTEHSESRQIIEQPTKYADTLKIAIEKANGSKDGQSTDML